MAADGGGDNGGGGEGGKGDEVPPCAWDEMREKREKRREDGRVMTR